VFALEDDIDAMRNIVRNKRRETDAEVHVVAVAEFLGDSPGNAFAFEIVFSWFGRCSHVVSQSISYYHAASVRRNSRSLVSRSSKSEPGCRCCSNAAFNKSLQWSVTPPMTSLYAGA